MDRWLLFGLLSLVALLSAPASAHADPALPDGFSKVTVATGLWDATAFAYTPDGRVFIVEKARARRGRASRRLAGHQDADRTSPTTSRSTATAACSASPSTRSSRPTATSTCSTPTTTRSDPTRPKTSRLTRITVKPDDTVANPATPGDGPARHRRHGAVSRARRHRRLHPVEQRLALDRHGARGPRRHAVGRLGRRRGVQLVDPQALRTYDETRFAGKILHIDRNGHGLPGPPVLPERDRPHEGLHEALRQGLPQPVPLPAAPGGRPGRRRRRLGHDGGDRPRRGRAAATAGRATRAPTTRRATATSPSAPPQYATRARRDTRPGLLLPQPRRAAAARSWSARGTPRRAIPAEWRNTWFVGDYVQGWRAGLRHRRTARSRTCATSRRPASTASTSSSTPERRPRLRATSPTARSNTARVERIVYNGNHPPPAVAHATPTSGSAPLPVALQRRRVGRPRRRSGHLRLGLRRRLGARHHAHRHPHLQRLRGVHRHADRPRLARGGERGQRGDPSSTAPRRSPRSWRPRTARCSATACRCTCEGTGTDAEDGTLPDERARLADRCSTTAATPTSVGDFTGSDGAVHAARRPRRRLLLRDHAAR